MRESSDHDRTQTPLLPLTPIARRPACRFNPSSFPTHPPPAAARVRTPHRKPSTSTGPVEPAPVWLQRTSLFILVVFCIYLGVIVTVLPWWTSVWDHNLFLTSHPRLWSVLRLGPARGVISGLGLLDIWIGITEAIHYHDRRA